ncbi:Transcription factor S-II (TFIIS) family protein [Cryptosporidium hominis]|nr:DNA-directed RNA polymerase III subunit RPC10 [Cryptosporidium hominis]PPA62834.1 Transcription factor S-II (TFIIS) family protein [Cryptosporidium hominis]PPS95941.1 RNA polymerases subunit/TFIIS-type Zinc finger containing protein [Cryptosporidium hominis]|eukprot:PPS95941.1 RNA polymerases subunit/TFIIS-type Zinc finger containing protein [Cryptosporidium hominis]
MAFYCPTCPYVFKIVSQISKVTDFVPKKMEEPSIDMNEIASSKTMAVCPKCSFSEAYFFQLQIRSADEPMTSFYTCVKCDFKWKEN